MPDPTRCPNPAHSDGLIVIDDPPRGKVTDMPDFEVYEKDGVKSMAVTLECPEDGTRWNVWMTGGVVEVEEI